MRIEGKCEGGVELGKRFYMPGIVIHDDCPKCKTPYEDDLGSSYLSYPEVGKPHKVNGYCGECEHEWTIGYVVVGITISEAPSSTPPA